MRRSSDPIVRFSSGVSGGGVFRTVVVFVLVLLFALVLELELELALFVFVFEIKNGVGTGAEENTRGNPEALTVLGDVRVAVAAGVAAEADEGGGATFSAKTAAWAARLA